MKIKCLLAALAISAFMCVPAQAQDETRHELSFGYGVLPNSLWIDIWGELFPSMMGATHENNGLVGPISMEYHYRISPLIGVGAVAGFSKYDEDEIFKDIVTTTYKKSFITFMPSVKFNWLRRANWGLYSKIAAGVSLEHCSKDKESADQSTKSTENEVYFNFQASALGFEAGTEHVLGFAELGIGEQGIALAGVRFKF